MDILDIDEVLKDDSFIFLEEKSHDDVSNILQQWKINNCIKQQPELAQEQVYKLNSRTFTRPKRKTAQNLESQFSNFQTHTQNALQQQQQQQMTKGSASPMLNLEIGGLVTTMHKSFLQDTSPPSSICSSMDVSFDCMNNSLITSADFANINFLQSTQSLDFHDKDMNGFDLAGKSTSEGYTLIDAIRDRKALESLTNSGDGTLIKDSQIAQIDDISLALSKTGSACSTMDNSTESVESNNRTVEMFKQLRLLNNTVGNSVNHNHNQNNNNDNDNLKDDLISDTTFNLVENSMMQMLAEHVEECQPPLAANVTQNVESHLNETFKKPTPLDETMLAIGVGNNSTFDCQLPLTPDNRCETPEGGDKRAPTLKMYESTPHTSHVRYNKQQYTPSIKTAGDDVNLSPIVAICSADAGGAVGLNTTRTLNDTYERPRPERTYKTAAANATFVEADKFHDETFNKKLQQLEKAAEDLSEMRSVMDMAQAEAALLNDGYDDEAQFERMLNQFDQVEMKEEQLKMKKSLETIKKRFNYGLDKSEKLSSPQECAAADETFERDTMNRTCSLKSGSASGSLSSTTSPLATGPALTTHSPQSSTTSSGERLLNRRSRLYDDFVPSLSRHSPALGSTSFTVRKNDSAGGDGQPQETADDQMAVTAKTEPTADGEGEATERVETPRRCIPQTKLFRTADGAAPERERERERDRDRFKTILIDRKQRVQNESAAAAAAHTVTAGGVESGIIIVPCIDAELAGGVVCAEEQPEVVQNVSAGAAMQRHSRRDTANGSNSSTELPEPMSETTSHTNPNFLTYKKLKDKSVSRVAAVPVADVEKPKSRLEPRSLSRPRYISGLQKFSVVSKATSAGDLENSLNSNKDKKPSCATTMLNESNGIAGKYQSNMSAFGRPQTVLGGTKAGSGGVGGGAAGARPASQSELKSPMGIKSKSFHNLSNNFGYQNGGGVGVGAGTTFTRPKNNGGLAVAKKSAGDDKQAKKSTNPFTTSKLLKPKINADDVFKVPNSKLVSGIRAPGTAAAAAGAAGKRLARPSSGYYSLNPKGYAQHMHDGAADSDSGLPTGETPLNASRVGAHTSTAGLNTTATTKALASLTKLTTTGTGIPKPSGLRAPSNVKRSGLPKPATSVPRR